MAKCKVTAHFRDSDGDYSHADLTKPLFIDVRDNIAEQWAKNGWVIIIKREEPEGDEPPKHEHASVETAAFEGAPETAEGLTTRKVRRERG